MNKAITVQLGNTTVLAEYITADGNKIIIDKVLSRGGEDITDIIGVSDLTARIKTEIRLREGIDQIKQQRQQATTAIDGIDFICNYELAGMRPRLTSIQHADLPENFLSIISDRCIASAEEAIAQQLKANFDRQSDRISAAQGRQHANAPAQLATA